MELAHGALLVGAGFVGGIAAAIAGGASLVTFPTLLALGLPPVAANATNAVGLTFSNFSAAVADWRRRPSWGRALSWLFVISVVGGAVGALLMLETPPDLLILMVPGLIGVATLLFAIGPWVQRHLPAHSEGGLQLGRVAVPLFLASIYGGYFGAALGVMYLAILSIGGLSDLRSTNVLKNILVTGLSLSSVWIYIWQGAVVWPAVFALMAGSIGGGYAGGYLIRVLPPRAVRIGIISFGTAATVIYGWKYWV
jgi:uncharacterized membrane protein YfcA